MSNELQIKDQSVPGFLTQFWGPTGFETVTNDCISIPFLRLAQMNTPQVQPGTDKLPGLEAGMYFNPNTGRIYGKEPKFVILGFYRSWNEWNGEPPDAKFVKQITNEEYQRDYEKNTFRNDKGKIVDRDGNRYIDTRNFFLLSMDHPEDGVLMYPMSSTAIPASKKWLAKATAIRITDSEGDLQQAPIWARIWQLRSSFVQSPKGNYFQVADVIDCGWIPDNSVSAIKNAFEEVLEYDKTRIVATDRVVEE